MRKSFRFAAALLALTLIASFAMAGVAEGESSSTQFAVDFANALDMSADDCMRTAETRALTTICLALDLMTEDESLMPDLDASSFIGKEGEDIYFHAHTEGDDVVVIYRPSAQIAVYSLMDPVSDYIIRAGLEEICTDGFYENDKEAIGDVLQQLNDALSED